MGALAIAVPYVLFVWWFSTGTVLFLVGPSERHGGLLKCVAAILFAGALLGVAVSSQETTSAGAYCVFTCAVLLWGAVEISFLAGWVTGPRPEPCPRGCATADRLWYALQAIAYHELALIGTAVLVYAVTAGAPNQLGWWTFAVLLLQPYMAPSWLGFELAWPWWSVIVSPISFTVCILGKRSVVVSGRVRTTRETADCL